MKEHTLMAAMLVLTGWGTPVFSDEPPKTEIVRIENDRAKPVSIHTKDQYGQYKFEFRGDAFHSFSSQDGKEYFQEKQGWDHLYNAFPAPANGSFILIKIQMGYEDASVVEASYCTPESTNLSMRKIEGFKQTWGPSFFWSKDGRLLYVADKAANRPVRVYDVTAGKLKEEIPGKDIDLTALVKIDFKLL